MEYPCTINAMCYYLLMEELYETDERLWREKQMRLIQENKWEELDYDCIFKMLLEMGVSDERSVKGLGRVLVMHLLKLKFQPEKKMINWFRWVNASRNDLKDLLEGIPSLMNYFNQNLEKIYQQAKRSASLETGIKEKDFPETIPFSSEELLDDNFFAGQSTTTSSS